MVVIVDIDGSIADWKPRAERAGGDPGRSNEAAYRAFVERLMQDEEIAKDRPIAGIREVLMGLRRSTAFFQFVYLTGRSEIHRAATQEWLDEHKFPIGNLIMRGAEDWSPAAEYKRKAILALKMPARVLIAIEDEPSVVAMLMELGITTLQVHYKSLPPETKL